MWIKMILQGRNQFPAALDNKAEHGIDLQTLCYTFQIVFIELILMKPV